MKSEKWYAAMHARKGKGTNQFTKAKELGTELPNARNKGKEGTFKGKKHTVDRLPDGSMSVLTKPESRVNRPLTQVSGFDLKHHGTLVQVLSSKKPSRVILIFFASVTSHPQVSTHGTLVNYPFLRIHLNFTM